MTAIRVNATCVGGKLASASMQRRAGIDLETGREIWEDDPGWKSHIDGAGSCWFEYVGEQQERKPVGAWSDMHGGNVGAGKYYSEKKLED